VPHGAGLLMRRRSHRVTAFAIAACLLAGGGWPLAAGVARAGSTPAAVPLVASLPANSLQAGAAVRSITPTGDELAGCQLFLGGYGFLKERGCATSARDELSARALALSHGGTSLVMVTLDLPGMGNRQMSAIRQGVSVATGVPTSSVMVHITHTHGGPDFQGLWGGVPAGYRQRVVDQAIAAAVAAVGDLQPVEAHVGSVEVPDLHGNRRDMPISDNTLSVLNLTRADASTVGTLVNYAAHPTVLGSVRLAHTDYVGALRDTVEADLGGVALYINGAQGDLSPRAPDVPGGDAYDRADALGAAIAAEALAALATAEPVPPGLKVVSSPITFDVENAFFLLALAIGETVGIDITLYYDFAQVGGDEYRVTSLMTAFALGDSTREVRAITTPGEALSSLGIALRNALGTPQTFVLGTTSDSLGYQIPLDEWRSSGPDNYEETISLEQAAGAKVLAVGTQLAAALDPPPTVDFQDVPPGAFFEEGVNWLVQEGITTGFGAAPPRSLLMGR
jgi:hypothetical protein